MGTEFLCVWWKYLCIFWFVKLGDWVKFIWLNLLGDLVVLCMN